MTSEHSGDGKYQDPDREARTIKEKLEDIKSRLWDDPNPVRIDRLLDKLQSLRVRFNKVGPFLAPDLFSALGGRLDVLEKELATGKPIAVIKYELKQLDDSLHERGGSLDSFQSAYRELSDRYKKLVDSLGERLPVSGYEKGKLLPLNSKVLYRLSEHISPQCAHEFGTLLGQFGRTEKSLEPKSAELKGSNRSPRTGNSHK